MYCYVLNNQINFSNKYFFTRNNRFHFFSINKLLNLLSATRKPYRKSDEVFDIELLEDKNPLSIFKEWFSEACRDVKIDEPNAMALATSTL